MDVDLRHLVQCLQCVNNFQLFQQAHCEQKNHEPFGAVLSFHSIPKQDAAFLLQDILENPKGLSESERERLKFFCLSWSNLLQLKMIDYFNI